MKPQFVVIIAVVARCWSLCLAIEPANMEFGIEVNEPDVAELQEHIHQLTDRVERLEAQLVRVADSNAAVQFTFDRPILQSAAGDEEPNRDATNQWAIPGASDEGMMIDAIEHKRRYGLRR